MPVVTEQLDREQREPTRFVQPAHLTRRSVEAREQAVGGVRVVVEEARPARAAVPPRAGRRILAGQRPEQELGDPASGSLSQSRRSRR